jgi:hypothetical protein
MRLDLRHDLPFVSIALTYRGSTLVLQDVLVDTGSGTTILSADAVAAVGLVPEPTDILRTLRGVGGREVVFTRVVDVIQLDTTTIDKPLVEIGGMDYGFAISGILGTDLLQRTGAVIDFKRQVIDLQPGQY